MTRFVWLYLERPLRRVLTSWISWLDRDKVTGPNCVECGYISNLKYGLCKECREWDREFGAS